MSSHSERAKRITDGDYRTYWESAETENPWVTITSPDPVYGLYLCFQKKPESYEIQRASGDDWVTVTAGDVRFHHVFYEMDGVKKIRIRATGGEKTVMGFNEIFVFGAGDFPDWVQRWEEPEGKADILFVATHPDDDALFLGSAIIYYNTELKKNVLKDGYAVSQAVLVKNDSTVATLDDLKKCTSVGCQLGTTGETVANDNGLKVNSVKSFNQAVLDLENGKNDAVVIDQIPGEAFTKQYSDLKLIDGSEFNFDVEQYGIAMPKDDEVMLNAINSTLADMKSDGTYDKLLDQYINNYEAE